MPKSLIVVFSWSGNCMRIAERVQEATGADLFRLEAEDPYPTEYKPTEARVIEEVTHDVMVPYVGDVEGWESYDTVFVGYPVWGYTIPQVLKKFLIDRLERQAHRALQQPPGKRRGRHARDHRRLRAGRQDARGRRDRRQDGRHAARQGGEVGQEDRGLMGVRGGRMSRVTAAKRVYVLLPPVLALALTACGAAQAPPQAGGAPVQETGSTPAESASAGHAAPHSSWEDVTMSGYREEAINVGHGGQRIWGVALVPETGMDRYPLVICSHGLGGSYTSCMEYAELLASHGLATYCFDFRGGGGTHSDGSTTEMSLITEATDVQTVIAAAKQWDFVDPNMIVLLGESQGGAASTAGRSTMRSGTSLITFKSWESISERVRASS